VQYYLIWERSLLPEHTPERTPLILTHKSVGMTILGLALLFFIWRAINFKPRGDKNIHPWAHILAKVVKYSLLVVMVLMPLTGFLLSCAGGKIVSFWGLFDFPQVIPTNKVVLSFFIEAHEILAILIVILVSLHVIGALTHQFLWKDNVLKRMLPFTRPD